MLLYSKPSANTHSNERHPGDDVGRCPTLCDPQPTTRPTNVTQPRDWTTHDDLDGARRASVVAPPRGRWGADKSADRQENAREGSGRRRPRKAGVYPVEIERDHP